MRLHAVMPLLGLKLFIFPKFVLCAAATADDVQLVKVPVSVGDSEVYVVLQPFSLTNTKRQSGLYVIKESSQGTDVSFVSSEAISSDLKPKLAGRLSRSSRDDDTPTNTPIDPAHPQDGYIPPSFWFAPLSTGETHGNTKPAVSPIALKENHDQQKSPVAKIQSYTYDDVTVDGVAEPVATGTVVLMESTHAPEEIQTRQVPQEDEHIWNRVIMHASRNTGNNITDMNNESHTVIDSTITNGTIVDSMDSEQDEGDVMESTSTQAPSGRTKKDSNNSKKAVFEQTPKGVGMLSGYWISYISIVIVSLLN